MGQVMGQGHALQSHPSQEFGLPFLPPYVGGSGKHGFRHGVNFHGRWCHDVQPDLLQRDRVQLHGFPVFG
ncbi:hypothetical protein QJS10_CPA03g00129 [Acorus calamus]|uniref:Uncharacterized protein n=1 Tax=Acorus calamus TaxID=4465 RepID=A0AAV9F5S1_ACOCL|nr:hypothetical protein QJS10_CPA03g00129 [Acorus calamus]